VLSSENGRINGMHHLIVIGGGPAALAAVVYALDKHLDVRIIAEELGGKVGVPRSVAERRACRAGERGQYAPV